MILLSFTQAKTLLQNPPPLNSIGGSRCLSKGWSDDSIPVITLLTYHFTRALCNPHAIALECHDTSSCCNDIRAIFPLNIAPLQHILVIWYINPWSHLLWARSPQISGQWLTRSSHYSQPHIFHNTHHYHPLYLAFKHTRYLLLNKLVTSCHSYHSSNILL